MNGEKRNRIQFNEKEEDLDIQETFDSKRRKVSTEDKTKKKDKSDSKSNSGTVKNVLKVDAKKDNGANVLDGALKFISSNRFRNSIGVLSLFIGAYMAVATISYFFTWQVDQDKVMSSSADFYAVDTKVENWLGKIGAILSHFLVFKTFGITSLLLSTILVLLGFYFLFKSDKIIWLKKIVTKSVFFLMWLPILLGFIFNNEWLNLGGGYGYIANLYLNSLMGKTGTAFALGASLLVYLIIAYNFSFDFSWVSLKKELKDTNDGDLEVVNNNLQDKFSAIPVYLEPDQSLSEEEKEALLNFEFKKVNSNEHGITAQNQVSENIPLNEEKIESTILNEIAEEEDLNPFESVQNYGEPKTNTVKGEIEFQVETPIVEASISEDDIENKASQLVQEFGEYDSTLDLGNYQPPTIDLLFDYKVGENGVNNEELTANKNRIVDTLKNYGIEIEKIKATIGPTVTLYEIVPAAGVRISKIKNLEDDIALSLSALGIRIIAPIPGKGTIGIEVPNQHPEMVPMKNIFSSEKFLNTTFDLPIALGKTISNETFIADLAKMPHLLMAGATGQGKSVGLNAILVSLLYKKHPSQIKFVLVDPKKVELTLFNKIERHFLAKLPDSEESIITDTKKVVHTLNSLCIEMDNRYELLKDAQVRNIKEYNSKFVSRKLNPNEGHKFLPYIVLVVDEFADLIMTAGKEVEMPIARLAQLARAIGIHLIIATQRPSVNIITGTIKANFPARIAFRVTSKIDSRTILDTGGAEQLIGRGDMLLSTGNDLTRIQCAFVDTPEVEKITDFIGSQRAYPTAFLLPEFIDENAEQEKDIDLADRDKMFDEAARIIVNHQQGSASLLQRKLKLGYNRAGRIVDQLESAGIIGKFEGSKARDVLVKDIVSLEQILNNLNNKD